MPKPIFAPQLYIESGINNIDFYTKGLGAVEIRRFSNDDGSIHVSELQLEGVYFYLHELNENKGYFAPAKKDGTSVMIGLFVDDVDGFYERAIKAGATVIQQPIDYDYGYRQGEFKDPFGHCWLIQKTIPLIKI